MLDPHPHRSSLHFELTQRGARRVTLLLVGFAVLLIALSTTGQAVKYGLGHPQVKGFVPLFYIDYESNVPTWYASALLLLAAGLLSALAWIKRAQLDPQCVHWGLLAIGFLYLSLDEVAMLHEYPIDPLRAMLNAGGLWYYTWVVPGLLIVAICACVFARFVWQLPRSTRVWFLLAAAVFVGGAIGVEMISGLVASAHGEDNVWYSLVVTAEESCELLGVIAFIRGILGYLAEEIGSAHLFLGSIPTE